MPIYSYKIESYLPDEKCKYQFVCDKTVCRVEYRVNGVPDIQLLPKFKYSILKVLCCIVLWHPDLQILHINLYHIIVCRLL